MVLRSAIDGNRTLLVATISGICLGLLVHATLSSVGLSAILQTSPHLYSALKIAGAAYLIYLGGKALYESYLANATTLGAGDGAALPVKKSAVSEFRTGLMTNILNPKVAVFYVTFLSQFINPQENIFLQSILLSGGHILMSIVWLMLIGVFVGYFKPQLEKPQVRRVIETITAIALIGFGLRLAF
ncbi:MAG: Lysine exporter protein [Pseudobdellovibrio sp.]|nr:Lysine exporter protein [Pseudobdellovibrio sp.]